MSADTLFRGVRILDADIDQTIAVAAEVFRTLA